MFKDQDYLKKTASYCLDLAKKLGATSSSAAIMHSISETVNFRNKRLEESDRSDSLGVSLTTYIGKKKSSISSSNLNESNIKILIERCIETTKITPEDEFNSLPDKDLLATETKDLNLYDNDHLENDKKIEYLKEVSMVGNDMMLDPGIGTCGKAGQGVPVGVAQPSILIDKMTVGGTQL